MPRVLHGTIIIIHIMLLTMGQASADSIEKLIMPGKVVKAHAKYEHDCNKCHQVMDRGSQKSLCLDCHKKVAKDIKLGRGFHGKYKSVNSQTCKSCHIEHAGRDADIIKLDKHLFKHRYTDFPLEDAHANLNCKSCHQAGKKYRDTPSQCYICHKKNPHNGKLGKQCSKCHSQSLWTEISFNHNKTDFRLTGAHDKVSCNSCHINNRYKNTPKTCFSCHGVDDVHQGRNGNKCQKCHNTRSWKKLQFDHNKNTKFKLLGRHAEIDCKSCHPKNPYKVKIKQDCFSCHKKDDEHKGNYGEKCNTCHGTARWSKVIFDHNRDTRYHLTGKHQKVQCIACHKGNIYKNKAPKECASCHRLDDVHKEQSDKNCQKCHNTSSWNTKIAFDHDLSSFPLIGMHAVTPCDECHLSKRFKKAPKECNDCHKSKDVHKRRLGIDCDQCHNPNGWGLWQFDHDQDTRFRIDGAHTRLHCYSCHSKPAPNGIATGSSCGSCHAGDDPHSNQFGPICGQCHDTTSFKHIHMMR